MGKRQHIFMHLMDLGGGGRRPLTVVVALPWEGFRKTMWGTKSGVSLSHGRNPTQHSTRAILLPWWQSPAITLAFLAGSLAFAVGTKSRDASALGEGLWPMRCAFCFLLLPQLEGNCPLGRTKWLFTVEQQRMQRAWGW